MKLERGLPLCPGTALGPVHVLPDPARKEENGRASSPEEELERLELARKRALVRTEEQYRRAQERLGREEADIFRLHRMMLEDPDFQEIARRAVREEAGSAREGIRAARDEMTAAFQSLDDSGLRSRAADVEEVSRLWQDCLAGEEEWELRLEEPVILAAGEFTPGQLIALEREKVLGLAVERMAPDSHAAILVRAMGLPTVTNLSPRKAWEGTPAALDGTEGALYLEPDPDTLSRLEEAGQTQAARRAELSRLKELPARTRDGREIAVYANIGSGDEAAQALAEGAEGVGLFRTEFLCLDRECCPGEEEQFEVYRRALLAMEGRRVVIRTLDIGGDKCPPWLEKGAGENPALGLRGIRLSLQRPELFTPQLRAILRAAPFGRAAVLFPMVTSLEEVRRAKGLLEECRRELNRKGIPTGAVEVGVMIETPAAALMAGELAREADFFSIGTNDLTQYTLAMDRQDPALAEFRDPYHPAVLELIGRTVEAGHRLGRRVAICGRLGADPAMTETFLRMGVDELSVPVGDLLPLKAHIRELFVDKK